MAHIAPPGHARRRGERFFGVLIALTGLAVAAVAIIALNHPNGRHAGTAVAASSTSAKQSGKASTPAPHSSGTSTLPSTATVTRPPASPVRPALIVLNNTDQAGLAATAADRFRQGGWTVTSVADYQNNIVSTVAYYDPSVAGAQAAADALQKQFPAILRVAPRFSDLPEGPVVVVLTTDYS